ncbi:hypothetical protein J6590_024208 [Homalodisca vitripennis]|nr:hypothetical protein J6590_024208 [Homalodisca vitripennis]
MNETYEKLYVAIKVESPKFKLRWGDEDILSTGHSYPEGSTRQFFIENLPAPGMFRPLVGTDTPRLFRAVIIYDMLADFGQGRTRLIKLNSSHDRFDANNNLLCGSDLNVTNPSITHSQNEKYGRDESHNPAAAGDIQIRSCAINYC